MAHSIALAARFIDYAKTRLTFDDIEYIAATIGASPAELVSAYARLRAHCVPTRNCVNGL